MSWLKENNTMILNLTKPLLTILHKGYSEDAINRKLGFFEAPDFGNSRVIMFHGVSVGEINAIEKLIKVTRENFPDAKIVVTTGTNTGQEIAHKKLDGIADLITYFPFDIPCCVESFLDKIKPTEVLMAETEIWPVFGKKCKERGIKLYIVNGRISDRTFNSYKKLKFFFKPLLQNYTGIFTQSTEDLNKFLELGAKPDLTKRMNNLKFDITAPNVDFEFNKGGRVFLAASTHSGEDKIVYDVYKKLKEKHSDLKFIIAPRHLTRLDEVKSIVKDYCLRSENGNLSEHDVMILDTMGELGKMFAFADVAFIGGSFNKTGGHNPLEATIFAKPVISGPSIHNFKDIYAIIQNAKAGFVVKTEEELYKVADKLFSDAEFYEATAKAGKDVFEEQQGALEFVLNVLRGN